MSSQTFYAALPLNTVIDRYQIVDVLGQGGFGITYQAVDTRNQEVVAIKEYLPREIAFREHSISVRPLNADEADLFQWGLGRFMDEAKVLAGFNHKSVVPVRRFFHANGTAYLVMKYCEGETLNKLLKRKQTLSEPDLMAILNPLLDALDAVHRTGIVHRDIKPGNIIIGPDGVPVLLDFGAARQEMGGTRSVTAMATVGYGAFEQYQTTGNHGAWTDMYGLGATLYRIVTGQVPPNATNRIPDDTMTPASIAAASRYSQPLLRAIDAALVVPYNKRVQNVEQFRNMLSPAPRRDWTIPAIDEISSAQSEPDRTNWIWLVPMFFVLLGLLGDGGWDRLSGAGLYFTGLVVVSFLDATREGESWRKAFAAGMLSFALCLAMIIPLGLLADGTGATTIILILGFTLSGLAASRILKLGQGGFASLINRLVIGATITIVIREVGLEGAKPLILLFLPLFDIIFYKKFGDNL